jgi:CBS domain-containing protein
MPSVREARLAQASVPPTASFREAAEALSASDLTAIAVVDESGRVVGLFTDDDLIAGLFPGYVKELRHTAFSRDLDEVLATVAERATREPVARHMREPVTLEVDTSAMHAAERFLHVPWGALAVVDGGRFLGMLSQLEFARTLLARLPGR